MDAENYSADVTEARSFRIKMSPDLTEYVLEWRMINGTVMTITSIKMSREGLAETLRIIDRMRDMLPDYGDEKRK